MRFFSSLHRSPYWVFIFLALSCFSFLGFGLYHLGKFETSDERLWLASPEYGRVHRYWSAWKDRNWSRTYINDKPGVTTAIVAAPGLLFDKNPQEKLLRDENGARVYNPPYITHTLYFFRLPFLFLNAALILALFFLIRRFTGDDLIAVLSSIFMYLSPILIGMTQIVNPDTTLWSLVAVALFSYLNFLKERTFRFLVFATISAGFALLSKYSALLLFVFLYGLNFAALWFTAEPEETQEQFFEKTKRIFSGYLLFLLGSVTIFTLFIPALLADPTLITQGGIGVVRYTQVFFPLLLLLAGFYVVVLADALLVKSRFLFLLFSRLRVFRSPFTIIPSLIIALLLMSSFIVWTSHTQFGLTNIPYDSSKSKILPTLSLTNQLLLEARPITFTVTPLVLGGVLIALLWSSWSGRTVHLRFLLFTLTTFIIAFYIAVLAEKILVHARYSIMLYPLMTVLAAIGFSTLFSLWKNQKIILGTLGLLFIAGFSITFYTRPFYFNYLNTFLPESSSLTSSWGFGGYEAAQYLNALPHAKDLVVWTDYGGTCVFFVGKCIKANTINSWYQRNPGQYIDYAVVTRRGLEENKTYWDRIRRTQSIDEAPVWTLLINGRVDNFVKIYQSKGPTLLLTPKLNSKN